MSQDMALKNSELYAKILADLSERLAVDTEAITLVSFEEVTWRDGSLGCPQPGMMYTMALKAGFKVTLEVAGESYDYHTDSGSQIVYCEAGQAAPDPGVSTDE